MKSQDLQTIAVFLAVMWLGMQLYNNNQSERFTNNESMEVDSDSDSEDEVDDESIKNVIPYDSSYDEEASIDSSLQEEINDNTQKKLDEQYAKPGKEEDKRGYNPSANVGNSGTWTNGLSNTWNNATNPNSSTPSPSGPTGVLSGGNNAAAYAGSGKADTTPSALYNSKNYLPNTENKWADMPVKVNQPDLIGSTVRHVGVNTIGQSLRNANLQLRSEPANPQVQVSPWMNTTIDKDLTRRNLE